MCLTENIFHACLPALDWNVPLPPVLAVWNQPDWGVPRGLCMANLEEGGGQPFPPAPVNIPSWRSLLLRLASCPWRRGEYRAEMIRLETVGGGRQPAGKRETGNFPYPIGQVQGEGVQDFIVLKQRGRRPGMRCAPGTGTLITVFHRDYHSI